MSKAATTPRRLAKRPPAKSTARLEKPVSEEFKREAMQAYCEWLFFEHRLLCLEMEPNYKPKGRWSPVSTASKSFHFPMGEGGWGWEKSPPSSRAIPMMTALGIDIKKHLARDKRLQRKFNRQKANESGRAA